MTKPYFLLTGTLLALAFPGLNMQAGGPAQPTPPLSLAAPSAPKTGLQLDVQTKLSSAPAAEAKIDRATLELALDCSGFSPETPRTFPGKKEAVTAPPAAKPK